MKKLIYPVLVIVSMLFLGSCSSTKTVRQAEKTLKGNWTLTNVTYSEIGTFDVQLYGDANASCFEGSSWQFVPNNNTATYQLNGASCESELRNVKWTIPTSENSTYYFMMKPVPTGVKAKKVTSGFRTELKTLTETSMVWNQKINFEGKPFTISMNFIKNQ